MMCFRKIIDKVQLNERWGENEWNRLEKKTTEIKSCRAKIHIRILRETKRKLMK